MGKKPIHLRSHGVSIKFYVREIRRLLLGLLGSNIHERSEINEVRRTFVCIDEYEKG
jgi:hypothetical protein